ncbi:MAG: two-component system response regulator CreB [Burkholderiales bacterium]|nr:two-component system response regulator CreB [Opitutaceae bacterium]
MNPSILIIEDEPAIADTLLYALATEGFSPRWCGTAREGLEALHAQPFALLVLDVGLPDANGFELCKQLRASGHELPIIFLTSRASEIDRIVGLEIGGDDYLTKPFSPRELTARVKVILRRIRPNSVGEFVSNLVTNPAAASAPTTPPPAASASTPFVLDEARCRITYRGHALDLTRIEFRLLKTFLAQPGRVFTRDQLLAAAWDEPEASLDRTVDAHVKTLRAKLRAVDSAHDPIVTHRGLGYSLRE